MKTLVRTNSTLFPSLPSLIDDFLTREWRDSSLANSRHSSTVPAVNILEINDAFKIEVAAPGMKREEFKLDLENNVLNISSQREEVKEHEDEANQAYTRREFNYQSFMRSFTLSEEKVEREKISARYADGILTINIPKRTSGKGNSSRQIMIG